MARKLGRHWIGIERDPAYVQVASERIAADLRTATFEHLLQLSLDYFGDSVVNSVADILAMAVGFVLAARLPVWSILLLTVAMEAFVGWMIRDNLTLNVLMLLWPLDSVKAWQAGA